MENIENIGKKSASTLYYQKYHCVHIICFYFVVTYIFPFLYLPTENFNKSETKMDKKIIELRSALTGQSVFRCNATLRSLNL